ncbi:hypothetical protein [Bdellovibrio sp. GT3]|uniref:hypothetical protein n=1 Tax=Bdellovibrio sp. GT3 TaxID=3136282 RepID=UPI0030F0DE99
MSAYAEEKTESLYKFNPVTSASARTLPQWHVAFQKAGGANINSNFLANSLSIGILPRFEMGVIPLFYTNKNSSNYTGKVNFWKGDQVDWAFSFTEARFRTEIKQNAQVIERPDLILRSMQLGLNYRIPDSDFTISPFVTSVSGYLNSKDAVAFIYSYEIKTEWGLDMQWNFQDRQWLTLGYGFLRNSGISAYEMMSSGFGFAWSFFRPKELFSRPSVGLYYTPETANTLFLATSTFYEF